MPLFKVKPTITREAILYTGENVSEISMFARDVTLCVLAHDMSIIVRNHHGDVLLKVGDYLLRDCKNSVYPCAADVFHETYEPASHTE